MARTFRLHRWEPNARCYRVMRFVTFPEGARIVKKGWAIELKDDDGNTQGFELLAFPGAKPKQSLADWMMEQRGRQLDGSCAAFSRAEVEAIAGLRGTSRTAHLTEDQKAARLRSNWRAEDLVESAHAKVRVYRSTH